jgi:hypothetical protein
MTRLRNILITLAAGGIVIGSQGALVFAAPEETNQTLATVTMMHDLCDYFIVETDAGFCIFEWFGGSVPIEGDVLRGDLDSYGFQNAYNVTQAAEITAYVEEYWLGREEAIEGLYELCGPDTGGSSAD